MSKAESTFSLLSSLLSDKEIKRTDCNELYEEIFSVVKHDVSKELNRSTYPQKAELIIELESVLKEVEIFTQFPEIIGKNIVGIFGTGGKINESLLEAISKQKKSKFYMYNNNIPGIIYNHAKENVISAVNLIESQISLNAAEYINTNKELYKSNIDMRQILYAFSISAKLKYENITFINFPYFALRYKEYYKILFNLVDVVIIPVDNNDKWKQTFNHVKSLSRKDTINLVTDDNNFGRVKAYVEKEMGSFAYKDGKKNCRISLLDEVVQELLVSVDFPRNNVAITDSFLNILSKFNLYQVDEKKKLKQTLMDINEDILNIEDDDTAEGVKKIRLEINDALSEISEISSAFSVVEEQLIDLVKRFEKSLYQNSYVNEDELTTNDVLYHGDFEQNCEELILNLIKVDNFTLARNYIEKLEDRKYSSAYVFKLYMDEAKGNRYSAVWLNRLRRDESESDLILKSKIKFGNEIGFDLQQIYECVKKIKGNLNGYECYLLGLYYEKENKERAIKLYKNALKKGFHDAGKRLMKIDNAVDLEKLADLLIPEANFRFGMYCLDRGKYARGITQLKIAATFEYIDAMWELADIEYKNFVRKGSKKSLNIAWVLYNYILKKNPNDTDAMERLGYLCYKCRDYRRARQFYEQCDSKEAFFFCGKMYMYGNGGSKDIYKARDCFETASKMGNSYASVEYEKVSGWILSNEERYIQEEDYSTTKSYEHVSSSGGCFLTTATCLALGKEDDCEELLDFKKYRDEHLINDEDGADLIREYYRIAPSILNKIEKEPVPELIYRKLYDKYITVGYEYLKKNDLVNAKQTYIKMVRHLCITYKIKTEYIPEI